MGWDGTQWEKPRFLRDLARDLASLDVVGAFLLVEKFETKRQPRKLNPSPVKEVLTSIVRQFSAVRRVLSSMRRSARKILASARWMRTSRRHVRILAWKALASRVCWPVFSAFRLPTGAPRPRFLAGSPPDVGVAPL